MNIPSMPWGPGIPCWKWPSLADIAIDLEESYGERAAIMTFLGGMSREDAERRAYTLIEAKARKLAEERGYP